MSKKIEIKALFLVIILSAFCLLPSFAVAASQSNPAFESAFRHPATKTDKELCLQSAYASEKVYSKKEIRSFLEDLGFNKSGIVQEDYESTATHSVAITMANRIVIGENGKPITLYALIIRGTIGSHEWISDFEVGASDLHTGFNSAAVRVMGHFLKYVRNHAPLEGGLTDENYLLWVSGHSRGAAVANLIAGKYMPKYLPPEKIYAYTYATPNVDKKAYACRNIINFVIQGDIVPCVPFSDWGYHRYGSTLYYTENTINGIALNSAADTNRLIQMITERVKTSEQLSQTSEALLQILQGKQQEQQTENPLFLFEGLFSTVLSFGTASDLIVEMSVAGDVAWLLEALGTDLDTDELFFTDEDFFEYKPLIGPTHSMSTYVSWMENFVGRIEESGVTPVPSATPLPTPSPTPMPVAVPTPAPTISPTSDPYAIRTESDIQADLMASDFLPAETIAIRNLRIDRRKTDLDDEIDTIYVTFNADTLHIRHTLSYTLIYELFNDGWTLTRTKRTAKTAVPLTGISNEELQKFFNEYYVYPSQNKFSNAKLITFSTDLKNLKETMVFQCSRTLNAQTDTWITTLELYFDTQDCQWYKESCEISDFKTSWELRKIAGEYHYSYSLSPYITLDVTLTPDGRFYYDASFKRRAMYIGAESLDFKQSGVITIDDFQKKYVSPGWNSDPDEFEFGYVFFVGEGYNKVGIVLFEGQLYKGDSSDASYDYLSNFDWNPEQDYNGGGWGTYTW